MKGKQWLCAALAGALLASLVCVSALAAPPVDEAAQVMGALGILGGDEHGDLNLERTVTRAEFVTMAVKATPAGGQLGVPATSPYPDVPYTHWAAGYVQAGVSAGLISGYTDGTFRPENPITLAEGATIALGLLGYTAADLPGTYPMGQLAMYRNLGLDDGVQVGAADSLLTRQDAMYLFYNLLSADTKAGAPYISALGYGLNAAGEVDLVALINGRMEGPVVAAEGWRQSLPFSPDTAKVYRDGKLSTAQAVLPGDLIYYNKSMRTLWVYTGRVTGVVQELTPSAANPTAVKVAGVTYSIETAAAAYALSDLGGSTLGDTVTLLLGKGGGVAAVTEPVDGATLGVVSQVGSQSYSDGKGGSYQQKTLTLITAGGGLYSYPWTGSGLAVGDVVQLTVADGSLTLGKAASGGVEGRVSSDGSTIGGEKLASGVQILDVWEGMACTVYPQRLAGLTLDSRDVAGCVRNSMGEIEALILSDVTGDVHSYGILESVAAAPAGENRTYYTYTLQVDGQQVTIPSTTTRYPVDEGPVQLRGPVSAPEKLYPLTQVKGEGIGGNQLLTSGRSYTLADEVQVYEYRSGTYYPSSLERVRTGDFTLTGWYDKAESDGGRIRVIVAR